MPNSGIDISAIYGTSLSQGSKVQPNGDGELGASTTEVSESSYSGNATIMYAIGIIIVLVLMRVAYEFLG